MLHLHKIQHLCPVILGDRHPLINLIFFVSKADVFSYFSKLSFSIIVEMSQTHSLAGRKALSAITSLFVD